MGKALIVSIKPEFAEKIFTGEKSIELRKCVPDVMSGDMMIIYCTYPIKAVWGICKVEKILKLKPSIMWRNYSVCLGIDQRSYKAYFDNSPLAVGIVLKDICRLEQAISLEQIRSMFPRFQPPQTFRYINKTTLLKTILQKRSTLNRYGFDTALIKY